MQLEISIGVCVLVDTAARPQRLFFAVFSGWLAFLKYKHRGILLKVDCVFSQRRGECSSAVS